MRYLVGSRERTRLGRDSSCTVVGTTHLYHVAALGMTRLLIAALATIAALPYAAAFHGLNAFSTPRSAGFSAGKWRWMTVAKVLSAIQSRPVWV